jgi:hypothetical protein
MIFTELLDMVEASLGLAVKDRVLRAAAPASGGAYTAVGNYPSGELLALVAALSAETGHSTQALQEIFGRHMFAHFTAHYGRFFSASQSCFDFLGHVEDYIHVEVRKLYPQAELPGFSYPVRQDDHLVMEYRSPRPMAAFATGLIRAAVDHFDEPVSLEVEDISAGDGTAARYSLRRLA